MSLECSECERDLRGGHDPACSRYVACECGHGPSIHDEEFPAPCEARGCGCESFRAARDGGFVKKIVAPGY